MSESQVAEEILQHLSERYPRFREEAYLFTLAALRSVMEELDPPRHVSGPELAGSFRDLAVERFGPMARTVVEHWGIHRTRDLGEVVYALVECGILVTQDGDSLSDFEELFEFSEAFERDYPWGANIS